MVSSSLPAAIEAAAAERPQQRQQRQTRQQRQQRSPQRQEACEATLPEPIVAPPPPPADGQHIDAAAPATLARRKNRGRSQAKQSKALPSRGSKNHANGQCKPCRMYWGDGGCTADANCNFCHYSHDDGKLLEVEFYSARARLGRAWAALSEDEDEEEEGGPPTTCAMVRAPPGLSRPFLSPEGPPEVMC